MSEQLNPLERSLTLTVSLAQVEAEVAKRLIHVARTTKMPGFRPGKVPMKMVEAQYKDQVGREVLSETAQAAFAKTVQSDAIRVASAPFFETISAKNDAGDYEFKATFEVFPEFTVGDIRSSTIERPVVAVGDVEIDHTIDILRKQRVRWLPREGAAQNGDRLRINYRGTLDGEAFAGGTADNQMIILGAGQFLPEFEAALPGAEVGQMRTFGLTFPEGYQAQELAGKSVSFDVTVLAIDAPEMPAIDDSFAKLLGVASGDVAEMRAQIKGNLEREVKKRVQAKLKEQVMTALYDATSLTLPTALVDNELDRLRESARQDWRLRTGQDVSSLDIPKDLFEEQARRRVALGMILTEVVEKNALKSEPAAVRRFIEEQSESYEEPEEMVKWYYGDPARLQEVESMVLEENVVTWALSQAQVVDKPMGFQELINPAS